MPSIKEKLEKSKYLAKPLQNVWFFVVVSSFLSILLLFASFKLVSVFDSQRAVGVRVVEASFETNLSGKEGAYVGSKNGKSYYYPWCGTVNRIKDVNLVWFPSRVAAETLGYKPATNCNGLK